MVRASYCLDTQSGVILVATAGFVLQESFGMISRYVARQSIAEVCYFCVSFTIGTQRQCIAL